MFRDHCKPVAVPVSGSGPSRAMYFIKTRGPYGLTNLSSGSSIDFCLSPGWNGNLDESTISLILDHLKWGRTRSLSWNVRFDHMPIAKSLTALGLRHRGVPIPILELESDYDSVFKHFSPTIRNQIRKGRRRGIVARSTCDPAKLHQYQTIYSSIAQEKGWQFIYPQRLTEKLIKIRCASCFIVAEIDEIVVAGGLFLKDGNSVFYMHGVADRAYNRFFPSRAVMDAAIRWACEIGAEFFNFGSCGQNMSLALFKSYWGTRIENNRVFSWSNPIWNRAGKIKARTIGRLRTTVTSQLVRANEPTSTPIDPGSWSQRAQLAELEAVLVVNGSQRRLLMMHSAGLVAAEKAISLARERNIRKPRVLDFGCGTGRMMRFFSEHGCEVVGLDVTLEMLQAAKRYDLWSGAFLSHFDGLSIPFKDQCFDLIWVCGVLKYTLLPPHAKCCRHGNIVPSKDIFVPSYDEIAKEMHRILKPGGIVAQNEMWVDQPPCQFTGGFEEAGFVSERVSVMRRYGGRAERICESHESFRLPPELVTRMGRACATLRFRFDNPYKHEIDPSQPNDNPYIQKNEFRDYLFLWGKPIN